MPPILAESSDAQNTYEDLSGVNSAAHANPYNALIEACEDDPVGALFNIYRPLPRDKLDAY